MANPGLTKNFLAGAAVAARRIVKFSADNTVIQAAAAADASFGVSDLAAENAGRCDVILGGITPIEFGGTITRGALVTSDVDGKAVAAAPAGGANARIIGTAMISGVVGDLGDVLLGPCSLQG